MWAWRCGEGWAIIGTVFNSLIMIQVTVMVEARMLKGSIARVEAFNAYKRSTSVWIPWIPSKAKNM